ncbi:MAG TPA: hypothetical protein VKR79_01915 [Gaiellaceae bacterium]|nr:hypothetical protein [Gaiellaceae bacterium]
MYDPLTSRYAFSCPVRGETHVPLSAFRSIERLPGAAHPAVFRVRFACDCGEEHDGLVTHDDLDWAPLGHVAGEFLNLMTSRLEPVAAELTEVAALRINRGDWPWSFFCYPEEQARPVFPSSFTLLTAAEATVGVAVRCPSCHRLSLNLVSRAHVDVPFHNDREVGVVEHLFAVDALATLEEFRDELWSASFDARRLALE